MNPGPECVLFTTAPYYSIGSYISLKEKSDVICECEDTAIVSHSRSPLTDFNESLGAWEQVKK